MQFFDDAWESFKQAVHAAARNVSQRGDHRLVAPNGNPADPIVDRPIRIGLFGNMANQAYITARVLRRLGYQVDIVIQPNMVDHHHLGHPFWEETDCEATTAEVQAPPSDWLAPDYCRIVPYDVDRQSQYQNRLSAVPEIIALYRDLTGRVIPDDLALLLAQWMGHWDYIKAMNDYDVVQLSTWPIVLGAFCPKPYVVCPLGGELYITAFEENVQGLLCRAGFRSASCIAFPETDYPAYLDRLDIKCARMFMPLIVDTDVYREGSGDALRAAWTKQLGGSRYLLSVCRQSWTWKGSDRLIRAFAAFHHETGGEWRLLLQAWGDDLDRSRSLVRELGLDAVTAWLSMCSKPLLRKRQQAADLVADQFVMEGYGTSVLESMAAGKPVIMSPVPGSAAHHFTSGPPPLVGAKTVDEIKTALTLLADDAIRIEAGRASRRWVEEEHGHSVLAPKYIDLFERVCRQMPISGKADEPARLASWETLRESIRHVHRESRDITWDEWDRVVPFGDQIGDRWEKARYLGFGEGSSVYDSTLVIGKVSVGARTWIGPGCVLDGSGGLRIGATCSVSAGCQLYSHDTVDWAISDGFAEARRAETSIGDAVYIGPNTVVSAGSRIGSHSIIGALSLVKGDIPPYSFAAGTPARVIGRIEIDDNGRAFVTTDRDPGTDGAIGGPAAPSV